MESTISTGRRGERAAEAYLCRAGFSVVARNWRAGRYELDLVAHKGETLHFVEVKSRKAGSLTTPEEAMTQKKFDALCMAAQAYLAENPWDGELQFDLAAVEITPAECRVRYIPNAVTARW